MPLLLHKLPSPTGSTFPSTTSPTTSKSSGSLFKSRTENRFSVLAHSSSSSSSSNATCFSKVQFSGGNTLGAEVVQRLGWNKKVERKDEVLELTKVEQGLKPITPVSKVVIEVSKKKIKKKNKKKSIDFTNSFDKLPTTSGKLSNTDNMIPSSLPQTPKLKPTSPIVARWIQRAKHVRASHETPVEAYPTSSSPQSLQSSQRSAPNPRKELVLESKDVDLEKMEDEEPLALRKVYLLGSTKHRDARAVLKSSAPLQMTDAESGRCSVPWHFQKQGVALSDQVQIKKAGNQVSVLDSKMWKTICVIAIVSVLIQLAFVHGIQGGGGKMVWVLEKLLGLGGRELFGF
ncbi:hypothetical protein HDV05_004290 [Chytridiales sp. JEL 0842]|nr:hypothetical protein HDV05_004290 [Chytridiales sp. JEL 0842]